MLTSPRRAMRIFQASQGFDPFAKQTGWCGFRLERRTEPRGSTDFADTRNLFCLTGRFREMTIAMLFESRMASES